MLADKPELVVHTADLTVTARALAKLLAEKCHNMFVQNGKPVLVVVDNDGAATIRPVTRDEVIIELTSSASRSS